MYIDNFEHRAYCSYFGHIVITVYTVGDNWCVCVVGGGSQNTMDVAKLVHQSSSSLKLSVQYLCALCTEQ